MNDHDQLRISHILDAITTIESYVAQNSLAELKNNHMLFDSITKQLIVIGEAINHLSEKFREKNSDIPFQLIVGMRNRLIHEYMLVNNETVWKTCIEDIPKLKQLLQKTRGN